MLSGFELYPRWVPLCSDVLGELGRHESLRSVAFSSHLKRLATLMGSVESTRT